MAKRAGALTWLPIIAAIAICAACTALKDGNELPPGHNGGGSPGGNAGASGGPISGGAGGGGASTGGAGAGGAGTGGAGTGGAGGWGPPSTRGCTSELPTTGTTYYVCACEDGSVPACQSGDDNNAGNDPSKPVKSYEKARTIFDKMQAGDSVAFCRGGAFTPAVSRRWGNTLCTANTPCTIRDYQPPWDTSNDLPRPRIDVGDAFGFELATGVGYQLLNVSLIRTNVSSTEANVGVLVNSSSADVLLCGLEITGMDRGVLLSSGGTTTRVALRESMIRNTVHTAIPMDGCDTCSVEHNLLEQNGMAGRLEDSSETLGFWASAPRMRIVGNHVRTTSTSGKRCFQAAFGVHGTADDLLIENNLIEDTGPAGGTKDCKGISVGGDTLSTGAVIRGNRLNNLGGHGLLLSRCTDCKLENNMLVYEHDVRDTATSEGAPVNITGMRFNGETNGLILQNNTLYVGPASTADDSVGISFYPGELISGVVMANNLMLYQGTGAHFNCVIGPPNISRIFSFVDNNVAYFPKSSNARWIEGSLSEWSLKSKFDTHSEYADPKVSDQAGPDFLRPMEGSPLIGSGSTEHHTELDIEGTQRHSPPDIGALEHR